ncbi:RNA-directed DNA polymerase-like protein [Gossypium australe]|uniref:RNA-directed DNA polymerase-like protein n=1 Tax=Gossypium australe TaxID=47621 RepID=A0A5B6VVS6_9ROSI|nr:RNA-directed DNA polymerase-like protein [Gossypium australe]
MHPEDMEKTTFVTMWGTFCYKVMPFGLKNTGETYQIAMVTLFHDMMHKKIEKKNVKVLGKLFLRLRKFKLKLNPTKCTFGATLARNELRFTQIKSRPYRSYHCHIPKRRSRVYGMKNARRPSTRSNALVLMQPSLDKLLILYMVDAYVANMMSQGGKKEQFIISTRSLLNARQNIRQSRSCAMP